MEQEQEQKKEKSAVKPDGNGNLRTIVSETTTQTTTPIDNNARQKAEDELQQTFEAARKDLAERQASRRNFLTSRKPDIKAQQDRERRLRRVALTENIGRILGNIFSFAYSQANGSPAIVPKDEPRSVKALADAIAQGRSERDAYNKVMQQILEKESDENNALDRSIIGASGRIKMPDSGKVVTTTKTRQEDPSYTKLRYDNSSSRSKSGGRGNSDSNGFGYLLRPDVRRERSTTTDGVTGFNKEVEKVSSARYTKEERLHWDNIAGEVLSILDVDTKDENEIRNTLTPLKHVLNKAYVSEDDLLNLLNDYHNNAYDVLANAAAKGLTLDSEDIMAIRQCFNEGMTADEIINEIAAINTASGMRNQQ